MKHKKIICSLISMLMLITMAPGAIYAENETTITVQSVTAAAGTTVDVPVVVQNNPGILGATLKFTYDSGLTLQGATNGSAFSSLTMTKPGVFSSPCNVTWDGQDIDEDDIKDGNILLLKFGIPNDAVEGATYNITASYEDGDFVDYNLNPIDLSITNGVITVVNIKYGDLDGDDKVNTTDVIRMRRHIAGGYDQTINEIAADVNLDTNINTTDVVILRRFIAGGYGIDELPYKVCKHKLERHDAVEPTETSEGNYEYWQCTECGKYFADDTASTVLKWEDIVKQKDEYTIQYMCDMVPIGTDNKPIVYEPDTYKPTQTKILPIPKMDTYKFLGWSDKNGRMFGTEIPAGTTGDLVLYANWASDRNKAEPVANLGDPIICEDSDNGQILFVYEIGKIKNIPLFETQDLLVANGVITSTGIVKQTSITKGNAEEIGKTIANSTTNSSTWTLSKDWNETTAVSKEWAIQQGMEVDEAEEYSKSNNNTYNITNSSGGSSSLVNNDSSTYKLSANNGHEQSNTTEQQKYTNYKVDGKYSNSTTVDTRLSAELNAGLSAGLKVPLKGAEGSLGGNIGGSIGAEAGISNTSAWEIGAGVETGGYTKGSSTGTDNWGVSLDVSNAKSSTTTSEKTWNSSQGFSSSTSTSSTSSVSKSVSELISQAHSENTSYSTGGSEGESKEYASSNANEDKYSSSVTYSEADIQISERKFESTGKTYGAYRLVQVGTARVFAIVGYDIKNKAYYTYTYSVLDDDEYKEYLDYSYDRTFNDYETSTLPFEIPGFVNDYVNSRIATSKLQVNDDGVVTKYLGNADDEVVLIPSYYTKTNTTTGKPELHKIKGIVPGLFKNNTNIIGVSLGNFVNEIPESAFEGCTSLKEVICPNVVSIKANAFKGCSSLSEFSIPDEIEEIGENAFDGTNAIKANPPTKELANIIANANVQNITLDISKINASDFSDMAFDIGDINTFRLLGGYKEYKGLSIKSAAENTIISGVTISECDKIPIEISSPNLTLERVTAQSDGFALVLKADETTLSLEGVSSFISESTNSMISKGISFVQINDETYSKIDTSGNVLVCRKDNVINNDGFVDDDKIIDITDEEYENYLTSRKVSFDANGGMVAQEHITVPYNGVFGELPVASRDYYTFDGWYTEAEGGDLITEDSMMTALIDITLYAHWTQNSVSGWTLASKVPSGAEIVSRKYTYTLTSYKSASSSSLSGWTKYDTTWVWSSWGSWSSWQDSKVKSSDSRDVQTRSVVASSNYKTVYHYYRIANSEHATWGSASWDYANRYNYSFDSPLELVSGKQYSYKLWCNCGVSGGYHTVYSADYIGDSYTTREWVSDNYKTQYRYRDRSKEYTYYFKKTQTGKESTTYPTYKLLSSVSESNHPSGDYMSNVQEYVQYRTK